MKGFGKLLIGSHGIGKKKIIAKGYRASLQSRGLVYAYALAVSEENASGGTIVTAPTCGACGVLPAVLYHMFTSHDMSEQRILSIIVCFYFWSNYFI